MLLLEIIAIGAQVPVGSGLFCKVVRSQCIFLLSKCSFLLKILQVEFQKLVFLMGSTCSNSMLPCHFSNPLDTSAAWMLLEGQSSLGAAELLAVVPPWQSVCLSVCQGIFAVPARAAALHATRESILQWLLPFPWQCSLLLLAWSTLHSHLYSDRHYCSSHLKILIGGKWIPIFKLLLSFFTFEVISFSKTGVNFLSYQLPCNGCNS